MVGAEDAAIISVWNHSRSSGAYRRGRMLNANTCRGEITAADSQQGPQ